MVADLKVNYLRLNNLGSPTYKYRNHQTLHTNIQTFPVHLQKLTAKNKSIRDSNVQKRVNQYSDLNVFHPPQVHTLSRAP